MIERLFYIIGSVLIFSCNDSGTRTETVLTKEEELKKSLKEFPDSLLVIENIVQYYRDNSDYKEAIKITDAALRKDSNETVFWDMKATLHFENGDTVKSIEAYNKLINLEAELASQKLISTDLLRGHIIALGSVYAQYRDPKALDIANELLENFKTSSEKEALLIKGMYYNFTGEKDKAVAFFDQCLALDHTYVLAYREKAIALYDLGKYSEALRVLQRATNVQNSFEEGYYWIGKCYEKLGKPDDAIKAYQMALMYDKDFTEAQDALKRLE